ncbi:MAG: RluA family pseudouridine synthase [Thermoanaerobaculia bacterium]
MNGAADGGRLRLARRVVELYPELTFTRAKRAVEGGQVTVDGEQIADAGSWVTPAQTVQWDRNRPLARVATGPSVELAHVDEDVVVAVKPAGLLTLPTPAREKDTLLGRVSTAMARRRTAGSPRVFVAVVHRLDKETSGLVAFALGRRGVESLQAQLEDHSMERSYLAILEGEIERDAGTFDRALVGDGTRRRRWVAKPGERGKPAVTHWRVERRFAGATLVRVRLETGRTHQIRIHFAAAGFPVLGERVYRPLRMEKAELVAPRQMLHGGELAFRQPSTGRRIELTTPPPPDFAAVLEGLGAPRRGRGRS